MRKLERDVLEIYAALGKSEEEGLAHDEFGALMAELGFLRFVDAVDSQNARSEAKEAASALNVSNAPVSSKESTVTSASTISRLAQFANSMAEGRARVPQGLPPAPPPPSSSGGNQTRPLQTPRQPAPGHPAGGGIKAEAIGVRSSAKALQHVHLRDEMDLVERVWFALVYPDEGRLTASTFLRFLRRALIGTSAASESTTSAPTAAALEGGRELQSPKEPGFTSSSTSFASFATANDDNFVDVPDISAGEDPTTSSSTIDKAKLSPKSAEAEMTQLCLEFARMYRSTLAYKPTHNLRDGGPALEIKGEDEMEACTFKPEVNKRSEQLEVQRLAAHKAAKSAAIAAAEAPSEDFQAAAAAFAAAATAANAAGGGRLPAGSLGARHEALYAHARSVEARKMARRVDTAEEAMAECSFRPTINSKTAKASERHDAQPMGGKRFEHLYENAMKSQHAEPKSMTFEEREVAECTFKPKTNVYSPVKREDISKPNPNGFNQAVERMRRAEAERAELEAQAGIIAQRRAEQVGKPPVPFTMHTDKRGDSGRKKPLLYMDINLGPGRSGRIGLHGGDDAKALAASFARTYQLDHAMQTKLTGLIEQYLKEVVPQIASENGEKERY